VKTPPKQEATANTATPIFGSAASFGGGGFGGFSAVDTSKTFASSSGKKADDAAEASKDDEEQAADEEECKAEFTPVVQLPEVEASSGEEHEASLLDCKCKLYRFDNESSQWKERGTGLVKLLQHKATQRVRLLMREDKTLKIRANHILMPGTKLQEHSGSEKAWVWSTVDFAEEQQRMELFCMRFGSVERAQEFKKGFEKALETNEKLVSEAPVSEAAENANKADKDAKELADAVQEKVQVTEDKASAKDDKTEQ
jgi:Ran-binding protein 1